MIDHTTQQRFWKFVATGPFNECWEWQGAQSARGYGRFSLGRKNRAAHRVSWMIHFGAIPEGFHVCHSCDNPCCVNPYHLWLGTDADNNADMRQKGRARYPGLKGERHPNRKLGESDILSIRALAAQGIPMRQIASQYRISNGQVQNIVHRRSWSHIP